MIYSVREWHTPAQPALCLRLFSTSACAVRSEVQVLLSHPHQAMVSRDHQRFATADLGRKQGHGRAVRQRSIRG